MDYLLELHAGAQGLGGQKTSPRRSGARPVDDGVRELLCEQAAVDLDLINVGHIDNEIDMANWPTRGIPDQRDDPSSDPNP